MKLMSRLLISSLLLLCALQSHADDAQIIDIHKLISLSDDEPVYRDVYISLCGPLKSAKKNQVVTAFRKLQVRDASGAHSYGEINIPVGHLKIIAVFEKIAIAREVETLKRDELPLLDQPGIMTGDWIQPK